MSRIRDVWPRVKIILRADSGFARDKLMTWCEASGVDYVFGLARNDRLVAELAAEFALAQKQFDDTKKAARVYKDFRYRTLESWTCSRRVVGKAEVLEKGPNPRFVVTSLPEKASRAIRLYEKRYCLRGDMENRIKEQFSLFAYRLSTQTFRANQIRLYFSAGYPFQQIFHAIYQKLVAT